ncbi:MAG: nucleotidyl transferase AbiEii/AbiGii toxin family protein, partial [Candidatus Falkowbacteria bacterium]|nr:nucleotidyl transferase AbiEii/AbiGii toxin family protein [Candidatus Falkowbacteria bacterium]
MFTLDQIKRQYPEEIYRRSPKAVIVEYLQYELLDSIFKLPGSEKLSFMGGTAIRLVYQSARFSEDLDFDNFGLSLKDFEDIFKQVVADMEIKGFTIEFRFIAKGAYHCYIKFPNLLAFNKLTSHQDEKILVRIDAVKKKELFQPEIFILNGFDVYRKILVNSIAIILSQKIATILQRKREKGRDFYDVSYLLGLTDPDYKYLEKTFKVEKELIKKNLIDRVKKLDMNILARDVEPFLIKP